jgi:hypothetical protein
MRKPRADDSRMRQVMEIKQARLNVQFERAQQVRASRLRGAAAEEAILHSMDDMLRRLRECARDDPKEGKT